VPVRVEAYHRPADHRHILQNVSLDMHHSSWKTGVEVEEVSVESCDDLLARLIDPLHHLGDRLRTKTGRTVGRHRCHHHAVMLQINLKDKHLHGQPFHRQIMYIRLLYTGRHDESRIPEDGTDQLRVINQGLGNRRIVTPCDTGFIILLASRSHDNEGQGKKRYIAFYITIHS